MVLVAVVSFRDRHRRGGPQLSKQPARLTLTVARSRPCGRRPGPSRWPASSRALSHRCCRSCPPLPSSLASRAGTPLSAQHPALPASPTREASLERCGSPLYPPGLPHQRTKLHPREPVDRVATAPAGHPALCPAPRSPRLSNTRGKPRALREPTVPSRSTAPAHCTRESQRCAKPLHAGAEKGWACP